MWDDSLTLTSDYGSHTLPTNEALQVGTGGDDVLSGGSPIDFSGAVLIGDTGNDTLNGGGGSNYLLGGEGNDTLTDLFGDSILIGGVGDDILIGGGGNDQLIGGEGNDTLNDHAGDSILIGGSGDDTLHGYGGSDHLIGGEGNDTLTDLSGHSTLEGGTGHDLLDAGDGNDQLIGGEGNDTLDGGNGTNQLIGGEGNDALTDFGYESTLVGGTGDDILRAGNASYSDLHGGTGIDFMEGGLQADTYRFERGDGHDRIADLRGDSDSEYNEDRIILGEGITTDEAGAFRDGDHLILQFQNEGDSLTVEDWYAPPGFGSDNRIEWLHFADGTVWGADTLESMARVLHGTEGDDTIGTPDARDYTIFGHGGNDTLNGSGGDDLLYGGDGNDTLYGSSGNDRLEGGEGDDILSDTSGNNTLIGGGGSDQLSGGSYNVTDFHGGTGNDVMTGGHYTDTYRFNFGDGEDRIRDLNGQAGSTDRIVLGEGFSSDSLQVTREGGDMVLGFGGSDHLIIESWFDAQTNRIEELHFADGTVLDHETLNAMSLDLHGGEGDDTISAPDAQDYRIFGHGGNDALSGSWGDDLLDGGAGDDSLYSADGNNTLIGGTGSDLLDGGADADLYHFNLGDGQDRILDTDGHTYAGTEDRIILGEGLTAEDTSVTRDNDNLVITFADGSDGITIERWFANSSYSSRDNRVEALEFADGTVWDADTLEAITRVIRGTEGDDILNAPDSADYHLIGEGGNDTLHGSFGNDHLEGGAGDDTLYGNSADDLLQGGDGADYLSGGGGDDRLEGGEGDDILNDVSGNNTLIGGGGNDQLSGDPYTSTNTDFHGGTGNDTMSGGRYADIYRFNPGDGEDRISDILGYGSSTDRILLGEGFTPDGLRVLREGSELVLDFGGGDRLIVERWFDTDNSYQNHRIEELHFADGTVLSHETLHEMSRDLHGTEGDDTLSSADPVGHGIFGYGGHDTLSGGSGDDLLQGGAGADHLDGGEGYDRLEGGEGDDILHDTAGHSIMYGGAGNDQMTGGVYFNGIFVGGTGNDTISGGYYADKYYFNLGDGEDRIRDFNGFSATSTDQITLGAGLSVESLRVTREVDDLSLDFGGGDRLIIEGWFATDSTYRNNRIEELRFADGTVLDDETLHAMSRDLHGTEGAETLAGADPLGQGIFGHGGDDTLSGGSGDDALDGGGGDDLLQGGAGADHLDGGEGYDRLEGGEGDDILHDTAGHSIMYGGAGDDQLTGGVYFNGIFVGGTGNDTIRGGYYADKYYFNLGDGEDRIRDFNGFSATSTDQITLGAGLTVESLRVTREADDLSLDFGGGDRLIIEGWFATDDSVRNNRIEELRFADGTVLDDETLHAMSQDLHGTEGADTLAAADPLGQGIFGHGGNDTLSGGSGDDRLNGGGGDDLLQGGAGADYLDGGEGDDRLEGGEGDDILHDTTGRNHFYGGAGDDQITGDRYLNGVFNGGTGDDVLSGSYYQDLYYYNLGDGADRIRDINGFDVSTDRVLLGEGLTPESTTATADGEDLVIDFGNGGDRITVEEWFAEGIYDNRHNLIESLEFADGTQWSAQTLAEMAAPAAGSGGGGGGSGGGFAGEAQAELNAQTDRLIDAMARFSTEGGGGIALQGRERDESSWGIATSGGGG